MACYFPNFFRFFSNLIVCGKQPNHGFPSLWEKKIYGHELFVLAPERRHLKSQEEVGSLAGSFPGKMPWIIWVGESWVFTNMFIRRATIICTFITYVYTYTYHLSSYILNICYAIIYIYTCIQFSNNQTKQPKKHDLAGARGCAVPMGDPELTFYAISDVHVELKVWRCWFRIPLGFASAKRRRNCNT